MITSGIGRQAERVSVRLGRTHRNLYLAYTGYAILDLALGLNFLFLHPVFDPLGIPKMPVGVIFVALGVAKLILLNLWRNMDVLRAVTAANLAALFFWCGALTLSYFQLHQTSLQLPITYLALGIIGLPLLAEPFVNPASRPPGKGGR